MLRGLSKSPDDGDRHLIRRQVNSDTQRARVSQFLRQSTLRREGTGTTCRSCNFKLGHYRKTDLDFFTPEHAEQALADERELIRTGEPIVGKDALSVDDTLPADSSRAAILAEMRTAIRRADAVIEALMKAEPTGRT